MKIRWTLADVTRHCFGPHAEFMLERGAVHPIDDKARRKACYIKGVQNGFFDINTTDFFALGFQAGRLSGIEVIDVDSPRYDLPAFDPNVLTTRGAHFYGQARGSTNRIEILPRVDLIANGNVVFWDRTCKTFLHPKLASPRRMEELLAEIGRQSRLTW